MNLPENRPRVVFDCNVLIQAISNDAGPAGRALRLLDQNLIEVYPSRSVLRELRAVVKYPNVRRKLAGFDGERIDAFIQHLMFRGILLRHIPHVFDYPRAQQDEPYIDLAAAANAHFLLSRDKDLLSLATDHSPIGKQFRQRFPQLSVLNPVAFLEALTPKA
jgi:putative PIN family toxin of toxin-antitoxin system